MRTVRLRLPKRHRGNPSNKNNTDSQQNIKLEKNKDNFQIISMTKKKNTLNIKRT